VISSRIAPTAARALAVLALLSPLWLAERAHAQHHDFAGRVVSISAQSIAVKDRRGNTMTFARGNKTQVEGSSWEAIAAGDQVLVRWNLVDGIARHVIVLERPPRPR
jgi:hypothetical protein